MEAHNLNITARARYAVRYAMLEMKWTQSKQSRCFIDACVSIKNCIASREGKLPIMHCVFGRTENKVEENHRNDWNWFFNFGSSQQNQKVLSDERFWMNYSFWRLRLVKSVMTWNGLKYFNWNTKLAFLKFRIDMKVSMLCIGRWKIHQRDRFAKSNVNLQNDCYHLEIKFPSGMPVTHEAFSIEICP